MTKEIDAIYQKLLLEIITFKIEPGERLKEEALSARFGVSRTPIRDVLKKLEFDGLLIVRPQSGSYVTKIRIEDILDNMYIRACVEYDVLHNLMNIITPGEVMEVKMMLNDKIDILQCMENESSRLDFGQYFFEADNEFHQYLYKKAGKESILVKMNAESPKFQRYRVLTFFRNHDAIQSLYEVHRNIVKFLENKDVDNLKTVVYDHNYTGLNGISTVKEQHPEWFD